MCRLILALKDGKYNTSPLISFFSNASPKYFGGITGTKMVGRTFSCPALQFSVVLSCPLCLELPPRSCTERHLAFLHRLPSQEAPFPKCPWHSLWLWSDLIRLSSPFTPASTSHPSLCCFKLLVAGTPSCLRSSVDLKAHWWWWWWW